MAASLLAGGAGTAAAGPAQVTLERFAASNPNMSALVWRLDPSGPVVVASVHPDAPRIPASNMKMVTAAGALLQLGTDFRFTTHLATTSRAPVVDGTLRGPLYMLGSGDPLLATGAYAARYLPGRATPLVELARPVRRAGIHRVAGPLVADESLFDAQRGGPRWPDRYRYYSQPLSALSVNQSNLGDTRGTNAPEPWRSAAQRMRTALRGVHVTHSGAVRRGITPTGMRVLATTISAPMSTIVREMNVPSDNFVAEMLTKSIGVHGAGQGTTAAGTARTRVLLDGLGVLTGRERLVDGSGLSRENRLTATSLVRLVAAADSDATGSWGRAFIASMPQGGEGTLRNRLRGRTVAARVRAKTGFINGASGLSGRVVSRGGARYAFSMLMNTNNVAGARATQDQVVTLLAAGREDPSR